MNCTASLKGNRFCDAPAVVDAPFPICQRHAFDVWKFVTSQIHGKVQSEGQQRRREMVLRNPDPVVYYIKSGDRIKIGTTRNMVARLSALMAEREDVLAVEPGDRSLEHSRHVQFDSDRIHRHREFFRPSAALNQHISEVREAFGDPLDILDAVPYAPAWVDISPTEGRAS